MSSGDFEHKKERGCELFGTFGDVPELSLRQLLPITRSLRFAYSRVNRHTINSFVFSIFNDEFEKLYRSSGIQTPRSGSKNSAVPRFFFFNPLLGV